MRVKKYSVSLLLFVLTLCVLTLFSFAVEPPEGSEILEYIQSSGTQFIDTLYKPNTNTRVSMRAQLLNENLSSLFGCFSGSNSQFAITYINGWQSYFGSGVLSLPSFPYGGLHSFELSKNGFVIDSVSSGAGSGSFTASVSAYLLAINLNGNPNYIASTRLYDTDIYDNGTLVRDYVPLRTTDGQVGLWDYVDGTFFPNVGTGTFTAGPVVEVVEPDEPEIPEYSITVQTVGSGTASASASKSIAGETITLTATPSDGYIFSGWEVVSGDVIISNNQFVMPDEDVVIKASFSNSPSIFSITVSSDGNGTASSSLSAAAQGTSITLTATPDDGFIFSGWQVVSGDVSISNNQFVMPAEDVVIKAIFIEDPNIFSITVSSDGNGTVSSSVSSAEQGATISLTAFPNPGYKFKQWNVLSGGVSISNDSFTMPAADVEIQAVFEPIIYTITVEQSPNGTASASASTAIIGETIYLTATPAKGYVFNYWEFTPAIVTATDNQFIMPAANITVKPVFVEQSAISSGFTYNSGILDGEKRSEFDLCDFSFGEQIAGKYIINIYHWGDSYDVNFYIYDSNEKYYPVTTAGGCSTFIYNHSGGIMSFDGSFSIVNTATSISDGWFESVAGNGYGEIDFYPPLSWTFNIENIVAVPLEIAQDSDFGIYSLIVGFLRDQFTDMKSFLAEQFEKISGTDDTQADVDSAADELNKEVEDLNNLSGELDNQASSLEQQFTTDFKVPDEISGNASNFQLIYTGIFQSLGIFSVFIWLPVVFAVIKKLLRL